MDIDNAAKLIIQEVEKRRLLKINNWQKELISIYSKLKYDKFNLPVLNADKIERIANLFLLLYSPSSLDIPSATPINELISLLHANDKVKLSYSNNLPSDNNTITLGLTNLIDKHILISENIKHDQIVHNYVIAHELGHLFLHTMKPVIDDNKIRIKSILDDDSKFIYIKRNLETVREWMEWQANNFAASLLIPQKTLKTKLREIQLELGINKNIGSIYFEEKNYSKRDFDKVIYRLTKTFDVSKRVCQIRLYNLDLINDKIKNEIEGYNIDYLLNAFYTRPNN